MNKKNQILSFLLLAALFLTTPLPALCNTSSFETDRTPGLWIEGQILGDMILGARAQLVFGYVDSKAYNIIRNKNAGLPQWMSWNMQYYLEAKAKKSSFFILRYKAIKNWNFEPSSISVGGYRVENSDIFTRPDYRNTGMLAPDTVGTIAFSVPDKYVKPGRTIVLSYGEDSIKWSVPER